MTRNSILFFEGESFNDLISRGKEILNTEYENCSFLNSDFADGIFSSVKFIECTFINCNLALAKLINCQLNNVTFKGCKLLGINFNDCADSFFSVKFDGCLLDYSSFSGKKMAKTPFLRSSLKSVDFSGSDLTRSSFSNCDLMNTVFNKTILKEVDFLNAVNYTIDPEMNMIKGARFSLVGLTGLLNKYSIKVE